MYVTKLGDTWDSIAYQLYGNENRMIELIQANPSHAPTVIFSAGVELMVPDIVEVVAEDLPPWKRGGLG